MKKRLLALFMVLLAVVALVACDPETEKTQFTVTFNTQGGSEVPSQTVEKGKLATRPANDPTKAADAENIWSFKDWYTTATGDVLFDFSKAIESDVTVFAQWTNEPVTAKVTLTFNSKEGGSVVAPVTVEVGSQVQEPAAPTKEGFRFGGWFKTKRGLTWLEKESVKFPVTLEENMTLHAYWEPLDSKNHDWSPEETFTSALTSDTTIVLNPLTYRWSHEDDYISTMSTPLYSTEVEWDEAIAAGIADFPGDFSKISAGEFSINSLDYHYILIGATKYPVNQEGDELLVDGKYDRDLANANTDTIWRFHLRNDVKFEDGKVVDATVWEYTLKQFLDPVQNNYRANSYFKTTENKNGYPIKNAYEYFKGEVTWDQVGFKVIDDFTFEVEFFEPTSQANAVGFGSMRLVHPEKYAASLDTNGQNSTYGTPTNLYISYGAYILKSWDENQKLVFNKNFDYVAKETVNYKSMVDEIVDDINKIEQLYNEGKLSVFGLTKDNYAKYADEPGIRRSYSGMPQNILINLAPSIDTSAQGHKHSTILFDKEFRQALLFGFNRTYYATNVYAPNEASPLPFPSSARAYLNDARLYIKSTEHMQVYEELGITSPDAYMADRAVELFERAFNKWIAEGNTAPVRLRLIGGTDEFGKALQNYVKEGYEALFTKDGVKRLVVDVIELEADALEAQIESWNFDLYFGSVGFGRNYGANWQMPFIAFAGALAGGGELGMTQPFDQSGSKDLEGVETSDPTLAVSDYWHQKLHIELYDAYEYLIEQEVDLFTEEEKISLEGYVRLWEALKATETKAAGIYEGTVGDLVDIMMNTNNPFDGVADEPFSGAGTEANKIIAAFEKIFLENAPLIPAVTRSGATLYAPNVVIEWPEFSASFSWGAARYRYLNTDPDFAE